MRTLAALATAVLLIASSFRSEMLFADRSGSQRPSLFAQSAAAKLTRELSGCKELPNQSSADCARENDVSFLLLDAHSGAVLASRWQNPETPIPLGSLVKPFTALAYGERHQFRYPTHVCRGAASGCWLPHGHGEIDLTAAIALSCNSYFRILTAEMTDADVSPVAKRLGLQLPDAGASAASLAGIGASWRISPLAMANAYLELMRRREQPGVRQIVAGMLQSAERGTGAEVDRALGPVRALVKTGTAPCTHGQGGSGDGFAVALMPASDPQILLMVRVHGIPGAQAAGVAGQMLRRLEE